MKYMVTGIRGTPRLAHTSKEMVQWGTELMEKFGLTGHFSIEDIIQIWSDYSDAMCATWLIPDKESVERVFCVELQEIEGKNE